MHHWESSHDSAVAPSPIVRTYRPDPPSKRRVNMTSPKMTGTTSDLPPPRSRGGSGPRPQARSAGTAERAGRNESLVDLVRFFQTQNMTPQPIAPPSPSETYTPPQPSSPSDTATALPVAISPKESKSELKQELKPFHRRLLQFAQRPKKEPSLKSKKDDQQRQIDALTREGYLIPAPLPKELKGQREAKQSIESDRMSVSRSLSKSKKDVEIIGQPWLEAKADGRKRPTEPRRRLASLDLDDFGSMVDVAVSLSAEFDDSVPPPYQPTENAPSRSSSMVPMSSPRADPTPSKVIASASSSASTSLSFRNTSIDEQSQQPSNSTDSNNLVTSQDIESVSTPTSSAPASVKTTESQPRASCDSSRRDQSDQPSVRNVTPSQPTLKLFPDVAPPRKSSIAARRTSAVPRYQIISNAAASSTRTPQPGSSDNPAESSKASRKSLDVFTDVPATEAGPKCPGSLVPPANSAAEASVEKAPKESASPDQIKTRRASLSMGTLKAFPLPAPTRPLPSLPELERCPSALPDTSTQSIRSVLSGPILSSTLQSSATAVENQETESTIDSPNRPDSRPATAIGSVDAGGSIADDEESLFAPSISDYSKSTSGLFTRRGRASSVRIPRMQEDPGTSSSNKLSEGEPLADSPVLGHGTSTKTNGKHALTALHINPRIGRKNLPFGLPTPPPTASLPSAPPPQHAPPPPPGRKIGQRNAAAPHAAKLSSMKSKDVPAAPGSYRNSTISQSDSSRSSLRNESFPDSYGESRTESRPESPLPSSDDEVFGPREDSKAFRCESTKHKRIQTVRREYGTADVNQSSGRLRLRCPQPTRSTAPQSRSNHDLEKTSTPQSQYSLSAPRLRESQSTQHPRPAQRDHYLEDRVANLERQNQMLQAALMAALNASGKNALEGLNLDPNMPPAFPHAPYANNYPSSHFSRPDSWVSSSRSSETSGFESGSSKDGRANVKQLDNMIEDIESGWMSDKSSLSGARIARQR
ncbi:uncharacterized protein N7529_007422 [Penicillium soppii]|uniref:uncharacterized protein n=1 Tax=Penicillium soppii TaxID=69789 RepID=UPI002547112A|nr:uncharacterized protein N7529_007422 [Penicillium soppii]KAJ5860112.1 hypothetical protein N7529_007422 [Penicillium soppii]